MQRRQDIFGPDADEFRPERWLSDGTDTEEKQHAVASNGGLRPGWAYIPFHSGPRSCIGQQFALSLVEFVTVRLMQEMILRGLALESRDKEPWTEQISLTASSLRGCEIPFVKWVI